MLRRDTCLSRISDFCHLRNFFTYFKFHTDWRRKIKQNELDRRDTAPLTASKWSLINNNIINIIIIVIIIMAVQTSGCPE